MSSLDLTHISPTARARVTFYPSGVEFRLRTSSRGPGGRRGVITSFSVHSRSRLRRAIMRLDWKKYIYQRRAVYATLTIRDAVSARELKAKFDDFITIFFRKNPRSGVIFWRLEYQRRGVPHLHLIAFFNSRDQALAFRDYFFSFSYYGSMWTGKHFRFISSFSGVAQYVSDAGKISQSDPGLDSPGRWWGIYGRSLMAEELCDSFLIVLDDYQAFLIVQRFVRSLRAARMRTRPYQRRSYRPGRWYFRGSSEFFDAMQLLRYLV